MVFRNGKEKKESEETEVQYGADGCYRIFGVILGGGILLSLPICNQKPIEFIDALFTSVSSVCVTGLVTIVPAEQFTLLGKIILLLLIQVGGLGVIACMSAFFLLLGKRSI